MDMKPKSLLKRVLQFAREELDRRARPSERPAPASRPARPSGASKTRVEEHLEPTVPEVHGLEVLRSPAGDALTLRWSVSPADVARAKALIDGQPVLCVRLVTFTKGRAEVRREVQDRPGVELTGECEIGEPPQRAVVSLGLRAGERFVSIAHHVL